MLNICLIGSGGVGTIASLVLEKSRRAKVTSVLRSNFEVVNDKGFDIESVDHGKVVGWRPTRMVNSIAEAAKRGAYDFVVVTIKALPDIYSLPDLIRPVVTKYTTGIVLLQSGLDIEIPIIEAFPKCLVMSGVSMIRSRVQDNNVFHEDPDNVIFGPHIHSGLGERLQREKAHLFVEVYSYGGAAKCIFTEDILQARWRKLLWNGTFNTLCALTRLDVGSLQRAGGTNTLLRPAMIEMYELAKAAGCTFPESAVDEMMDGTPQNSPFRPSMLVDLDKGNPLELEVILGAPLRHAKKLGVETPVLRMVYDLLRLTQYGIFQRRIE